MEEREGFQITNMLKFIHTADTHLRDLHLGVTRRGPDFTAALNQVIDLAIENKVDAILHGGDMLDKKRPSAKNIQDLMYVHARLVENRIPMLIVGGNHDFDKPSWIDIVLGSEDKPSYGVHGLINMDNQKFTIKSKDGEELSVYGLPPMSADDIRMEMLRCPGADILLWHGAIREMCGFPNESYISIDEIPHGKFRMVLLGDIHKRQYVKRSLDNCIIGYPGATELVKQNEPLEHSCELFVCSNKVVGHQPIPLDTRPAKVYSINDEKQLMEMLAELKALPKTPAPMVFGRYDNRLEKVLSRVYSIINPDEAIIRLAPYPKTEVMETTKVSEERLLPKDFVSEFLAEGTDMHDMAVRLCDAEANHRSIVDDWVEKRMVKILNP